MPDDSPEVAGFLPGLYPPPQAPEDRLAWLRLIRSSRVGPATFHRLMAEHGSAGAALAALPGVARAAGVDHYRPCPEEVARAELRAGRLAGAQLIAIGERLYPAALATLRDPPPLIWALGDTSLLTRPAVGLVGTRQASSLGSRMARALAQDLGTSGLVVVSGLARGIDAAAHLGGLATGTIAVLPGGVDVVVPPENAVLAQEIADRGLRVSDQPMGLLPQASHFARRNRIIAGLSQAVVVVEAATRSGALITARDALDAGREVMAVPGHPMDSRASGCNQLLRDGAVLVRGARDVLAALAPPADPPGSDAGRATAEAPGSKPAVAGAGQAPWQSGTAIPGADEQDGPAAPRAADVDAPNGPARKDDGPGRGRRMGLKEAAGGASGIPVPPPRGRSLRETAALHGQILARLCASPVAEDQLIRDLGLPAGEIGREIVALEIEGQIERRPGGYISRLQ